MNLKKKYKVAVLGSNGQVGKCLQKYKREDIIFFKKNDLDIRKSSNYKILKNYDNIEIIINLAAKTDLHQIEKKKNETYKNNILGTFKLINYCKKEKIYLIHLSSDYIYKDSKFEKKENSLQSSSNYYSYSKLVAEKYIKSNLKNYLIIRTSNIFSEFNLNILTKIIQKIKNRNNLFFYNNIFYNPTSADSLSKVILKLIKLVTKKNLRYRGIFNFAQYPATTPYLFAEYVLKNFDKKGNINLNSIKYENQDSLKRPFNSTISSDKLNTLLNLKKSLWKKSLISIKKKYEI